MSISLSNGVRQSLASISDTAAKAQVAQLRLATGKKVNSAIDNPQAFFTASGLNNRAGDLSKLMDAMGQGIKVVEAADKGIKAITKLVETAKGLAASAKQAGTDAAGLATRSALATQYDEIRSQITDLAGDSGYNGLNLIKTGPDSLTVEFSEADPGRDLTITGSASDAAGLGLTAAQAAWAANTDVDADIADMDAALSELRSTAATFGANAAIITARQDFTKGMIDTLKSGADALVLADSNEEGANLLAMQTRGQLAQTALSLASQADQAVLRLF
jgi:flagellin-like hook-associated protein FlgL